MLLQTTMTSFLFTWILVTISPLQAYVSVNKVMEEQQRVENQKRIKDLKRLKEAKYYLLNGNLERAERELLHMKLVRKDLIPVRNRYLGLLNFIKNDYGKALQYLSHKSFSHFHHYAQTCHLKIILKYLLHDLESADRELIKCSQTQKDHLTNNFIWTELLLSQHKSYFGGSLNHLLSNVDYFLSTYNSISLWAKTGLYFQQSDVLFENMVYVPQNLLQSKYLREVIGFLYFRKNDYDLALNFLKDIKTANSENIRGNMALINNEYQKAYELFNSALTMKRNSWNAVNRLVPLVWTLQKWKDGLKLINKIPRDDFFGIDKRILKAVLLTHLKSPQKALTNLEIVYEGDLSKVPTAISEMFSYNQVLVGEKTLAKKYAHRNCRSGIGIYCWLLFQVDRWPNFSLYLQRTGAIEPKLDQLVSHYTGKQEEEPIDEEIFIDQKNIEELDDIKAKKMLILINKNGQSLKNPPSKNRPPT